MAALPRQTRSRAGLRIRGQRTSSGERTRFPDSYDRLVRDVQLALRRFTDARRRGEAPRTRVVEVEFPVSGLDSVAGDGEGCAEMSASCAYLTRVLSELSRDDAVERMKTRVLFPDKTEMLFQREKIFEQLDASQFRLGHLTNPSPWLEIGWDKNKKPIKELTNAADDDELFVAAYPHFNVNETLAIRELDEEICEPRGKSLVIVNGELDRFRGNYYPGLFYPKCKSLSEEWLPRVDALYYLHNFRGSRFGSLYRCWPNDWHVLRRVENEPYSVPTLLCSFASRPTLAEVAEIIRQS